MPVPERRTTIVLMTILSFAAVCAAVYEVRRVILLFVLSVFFAYLLNPAVKFLQNHSLLFRHLRRAAVMEAYVGILVLVAFVGYSIAPALARHSMKAADGIPVVLERLSTGDVATDIGNKYGWNDEEKARLKTMLVRHREDFQGLLKWIDGSLSQAAQIVAWLALIPVLAIFLLRDGNHIVEAAIRMFLPPKYKQQARFVTGQIHAMLTRYIRAQFLLGLFSSMFYTAVLLLFGFPHAIVISIFGGMLEFVPVVGWMSTAAIIIAIGMANDLRWGWIAVLLLLWRAAQNYFNLPRVLGRGLELHPLTVIFAVLAGAEVGGIIGIYLAVPFVASLLLIWRLRASPADVAPTHAAESELRPRLAEMTRD